MLGKSGVFDQVKGRRHRSGDSPGYDVSGRTLDRLRDFGACFQRAHTLTVSRDTALISVFHIARYISLA
jgi:hypothetical protein